MATGAAQTAAEIEPILVGVGASAGGIEAFTQLLQALPGSTNLAFVLVQHLSPQHESTLPTLLSAKTSLRVIPVTEGVRVERNHVYVIPPNVHISVSDGQLHLLPRPHDRTQYTPVDSFFESLARAHQNRAIGIVLSGTASDGAAGLRAIKAAGGITIAQRPSTAKYDGMPKASIATGIVDLVLAPPEIADRLIHIQQHPYVLETPRLGPDVPTEQQLGDIFSVLKRISGVDFRQYKRATVRRRVLRRMALHRRDDVASYLELLRSDAQEVVALHHDLFIHVTRFFRDPESFDALADIVLSKLANKDRAAPIRVWVPGCATGEEAYSLAILLLETMKDQDPYARIQIFATDVSESAIEHARAGVYLPTIVSDVAPDRLKRHFSKIDGGYKVNKPLRDMCVFARHDLTRDAPFSRLDLIICRNVLIYLDADLQKRLMSVFHYALNPTGFLMLGPAETTGHQYLFTVLHKKWKIYEKANVQPDPRVEFNERLARMPTPHAAVGAPIAAPERHSSIQEEANRQLLQRFSPAGVIVDANNEIIQFRGQTGRFLEAPPGEPSLNVLKMAREGLLHPLRATLSAARRTQDAARSDDVLVKQNGEWHRVEVEVIPLSGPATGHFVVLFHSVDRAAAKGRQPAPTRTETRAEPTGRVASLMRELSANREYLQSIIQELEAANEELQSANEEILSSNEELQSTNEELDTAREELQSTNEELNTVNEELHSRNEELTRVNTDLVNLLASVEIMIAIVGEDLRIRRFTPSAQQVLNLIPGDMGRPIDQINSTIVGLDIGGTIKEAIENVEPVEREVQDRAGRWYSFRARPYKGVNNRIEGAILALADIDAAKRHELEMQHSRDYFVSIFETVREPLVVLDPGLRVKTANPAFYNTLVPRDAAEHQFFCELGDGRWNRAELRDRLQSVATDGEIVENFPISYQTPEGGARRMLLNARRVPQDDGDTCILVAMEDQNVAAQNA